MAILVENGEYTHNKHYLSHGISLKPKFCPKAEIMSCVLPTPH